METAPDSLLVTWDLWDSRRGGHRLACDDREAGVSAIVFSVAADPGQPVLTTIECPPGARFGEATLRLPAGAAAFTVSATTQGRTRVTTRPVGPVTRNDGVAVHIYLFDLPEADAAEAPPPALADDPSHLVVSWQLWDSPKSGHRVAADAPEAGVTSLLFTVVEDRDGSPGEACTTAVACPPGASFGEALVRLPSEGGRYRITAATRGLVEVTCRPVGPLARGEAATLHLYLFERDLPIQWQLWHSKSQRKRVKCDHPLVGVSSITLTAVEDLDGRAGQSAFVTVPCPAGAHEGRATLRLPTNSPSYRLTARTHGHAEVTRAMGPVQGTEPVSFTIFLFD
jgi:hypothetical protein